jgi:two-component system, OmpR family, alkaline phosphatase synthesis response regulator PhoP
LSKSKILVVDDEQHILELVEFNLNKEGYEIITAADGEKAIELAQKEKPDLIVLDIMLPKIDGLSVCRSLYADNNTNNIPILMLTARGEVLDKVLGLEMGADDYMTKPFSPRELVARVKAILRRTGKSTAEKNNKGAKKIYLGEVAIDAERFTVTLEGKKLDFTPKEFELLRILASSPGKVFTREFLLENIWGYDFYGDTRTVDVHIRHIRQKIEPTPDSPKYIETIRGVGYKVKEQD